ncbi:hypothetical protein TEA_006901 [Camellia sinensis var. sinensis]|uniref:tRNA/rRNA methyltransferase SpoU type domain-containing protein n=1 Tax=Camellia sinensis var. sinensis TaxID=542762 RepID=A0A4S4DDV7_CAMSN|nr:hypothetical protein TEA_006901 [Camellia sinensis var. sinensis]
MVALKGEEGLGRGRMGCKGGGQSLKGDGLSWVVKWLVGEVTSRAISSLLIPGNTGCIARTCAASAVGLHLVGVDIPAVACTLLPLGFQVDDAKLKRAGLDYWPRYCSKQHKYGNVFNFGDIVGVCSITKRSYSYVAMDFSYRRGDWLVFGSETSGLPPEVVLDCKGEEAFGFGGGTIQIPMVETYVRCLNLSVSVGIALYEASRQLNYEQLLKSSPSQTCMDAAAADNSFIAEDIFA